MPLGDFYTTSSESLFPDGSILAFLNNMLQSIHQARELYICLLVFVLLAWVATRLAAGDVVVVATQGLVFLSSYLTV